MPDYTHSISYYIEIVSFDMVFPTQSSTENYATESIRVEFWVPYCCYSEHWRTTLHVLSPNLPLMVSKMTSV